MTRILTQSLNSDQPLPLGAAPPKPSFTYMRSMFNPAIAASAIADMTYAPLFRVGLLSRINSNLPCGPHSHSLDNQTPFRSLRFI